MNRKKYIEQRKKEASSAVRNIMSLELNLMELSIEGSLEHGDEITGKYDPKLHEMCEHVPIHVVYEGLNNGKVRNIEDVALSAKKAKGAAYSIGKPLCIEPTCDEGESLVVSFPVVFYRFKNRK